MLRQTVEVVHDRIDAYTWVGLAFIEDGNSCSDPRGRANDGRSRIETPVVYRGMHVATLLVETEAPPTEQDTCVSRAGRSTHLRSLPRGMGHRRRAVGGPGAEAGG